MRDGDEGEEVRRCSDGGNKGMAMAMAMAMMKVTVTVGVMLMPMV